MPYRIVRAVRWVNAHTQRNWIVFLGFLSLAVLSYGIYEIHSTSVRASHAAKQARDVAKQAKDLSKENKQRIADIAATQKAIQASRVASCKKTYAVIESLFRPFTTRPNQTAQQRADANKFFGLIDTQKAKCAVQVKPIRKPKPGP